MKLLSLVQVGAATAIGEQPVKGLVDPGCGARMSVAESLTNLIFARISDLKVYRIIFSVSSPCFPLPPTHIHNVSKLANVF